ncbi:MAG: thioredoxin fold domain-containing protein [Arcobacter sp.]|nr:thioredoxin fold domain-containing protein [Arcobacter sp.]
MIEKILLILCFSFSCLFAFEKLTLENFEEKVKNKNVVLDFYAKTCSSCKVLAKNLEEYNKNKKENVFIYKIDIEEQKELAKEFGVRIIPVLIYFKDDEIIDKDLGIQTPLQIKNSIKNYFKL